MNSKRIDLSEWVIHFVHNRNPINDPRQWEGEFTRFPVRFNTDGKAEFTDWDFYDEEYPIEPNARAYQVLEKILFDGHIRSGWSFRNYKPTIYGPNSAVCFTEMPLYALIEYAEKRNSKFNVNTYGIALLKKELFRAGGRPVIYGLSGNYSEARQSDLFFGLGLRCLAPSCGIGLTEQYRYVHTNMQGHNWADWTHEREWRWAYTDSVLDIPGLPVWLEESKFSIVLVIMNRTDEAIRFIDKMKEYYDSGSNNFGYSFNKAVLLNTKVIALEELEKYVKEINSIRIEDLPLRQLPKVSPVKVSTNTINLVKRAIELAEKSAIEAAEEFKKNVCRDERGHIRDVFGAALIKTYESHTEITQALIDLGYAKSIGGLGYFIGYVTKCVADEGMLCIAEVAAYAAANKMSELLGQKFIVETRLD